MPVLAATRILRDNVGMSARRVPLRDVGIFIHERVQLLDVAGPVDVFAVANDELRARGGTASYRITLIADARGPVRTSSGVCVSADLSRRAALRDWDTLLVAGGDRVADVARDAGVLRWLQQAAGRSRRVGAICTGAWLLAAAGLLRGRRAVTHWAACDALASRFADVRVEPDAIFVRDGKCWTSAGASSGIDLSLALVEEDHGRDIALAVARVLVLFLKRPGGQSQFSAALVGQFAERGPVRDAQRYALEHPAVDLSVETLAERAAMSTRHFARIFVRETGTTPGDFIERVRVDAARRLLEDTSESVEQIARRCGLGEPDTMRRAFLRRIGIPPRDYRARFRTALDASVEAASTA